MIGPTDVCRLQWRALRSDRCRAVGVSYDHRCTRTVVVYENLPCVARLLYPVCRCVRRSIRDIFDRIRTRLDGRGSDGQRNGDGTLMCTHPFPSKHSCIFRPYFLSPNGLV